MPVHENLERSLIKAITYRVLIVIATAIVVFIFTHKEDTTVLVVTVSSIANTILYILHERIWNTIQWGRFSKKKK